LVGTQALPPEAEAKEVEVPDSDVFDIGVGKREGALAITDKGGKMLKIESSAFGGPYESKGSGTD
jgi:hypothetical protein